MDIDPQIMTNLIFCILTLALGITAYIKMKRMWALLLGVAFACFGVSHLFTILDLAETLDIVMLVTRTIGYLLTIWVIYWYACRKYARES
jgi:predicted membrane channel-forming protein YqfA (hemolysin III family)